MEGRLESTRLTCAMVIAIVGIHAICIQPQLSNVIIESNTLQHPFFVPSFPLSFPSSSVVSLLLWSGVLERLGGGLIKGWSTIVVVWPQVVE